MERDENGEKEISVGECAKLGAPLHETFYATMVSMLTLWVA